jgi:membrane carboxypeptidase/penicillin-binding protein
MKSKINMANVFEDANEKNDENIEKSLLKKNKSSSQERKGKQKKRKGMKKSKSLVVIRLIK